VIVGRRLDREDVLIGPSAPAQVEDRLARPVARQLGLRAVGIVDPQLRHEASILAGLEQQNPVGEYTEVPFTKLANARRSELELQLGPLHDQVIVSECLPLLEFHACHLA
jgi:hypothetical protein